MDEELKNTKPADYIAMVVIVLMAIGTVFVFSAGTNIQQQVSLQKFYQLPGLRQILFFPVAVVIMFAASGSDYRRFALGDKWYKSLTVILLTVSVVLLILVLFPQIGTEINRARRWIHIPLGFGTVSFQPSELAKWSVVFFLAGFCDKYHQSIQIYWKRFAQACLIGGVVVGLIIIEDFGTAALIALLMFLMLVIGGANCWHLLTPIPAGVVLFLIVLFKSPHRLERIAAFLHPEKWADSVGYQANQSLIALGSGRFFGKGLGLGICKYGHLPEDTTDFIFAIIGEELGFFGTLTVIALFIVFVWLGIMVIVRCEDRFGRLLASGIILTIGAQAALNIGVVTVVLPTKGLPLPFVSAGGTSMLLSAAAVGVLLNIAKSSVIETEGSDV